MGYVNWTLTTSIYRYFQRPEKLWVWICGFNQRSRKRTYVNMWYITFIHKLHIILICILLEHISLYYQHSNARTDYSNVLFLSHLRHIIVGSLLLYIDNRTVPSGTCGEGMFKCGSTDKCVHQSSVCDARNDCGDCSDEQQACGMIKLQVPFPSYSKARDPVVLL